MAFAIIAAASLVEVHPAHSQDLSIPYCEARDFSDRCLPDEDSSTCEPKKQAASDLCKAYLERPEIKLSQKITKMLNDLSNYTIEIAGYVAAIVLGAISIRLKGTIDSLRQKFIDPFVRRDVEFEIRGINIVIVGQGGTGKTTLIHALSGSDLADPEVSTASFCTYSLSNEFSIEKNGDSKRRMTRFYIDDYIGQNISSLIFSNELEDRKKKIKATMLVIVVDLFFPSENDSQRNFNNDRVRENINIFNDQVVQILVQMLNEGSRIVLFINKFDMISSPAKGSRRLAIESYSDLIAKLNRIRGMRLHVIVGSARTGSGVVGYDGGNDDQKSLYKIAFDNAHTI